MALNLIQRLSAPREPDRSLSVLELKRDTTKKKKKKKREAVKNGFLLWACADAAAL